MKRTLRQGPGNRRVPMTLPKVNLPPAQPSLRAELRWLDGTFRNSTEHENFECHYGLTLGACPDSNDCVACSLLRFFDKPAVREAMR